MPGPCVVCGIKNYPLSMGGPTICPACDCGYSGPQQIAAQRGEIERLQDAKRRALAIADERAKEIERLRAYIWSLDGKYVGTSADGVTFLDEGIVVATDILEDGK